MLLHWHWGSHIRSPRISWQPCMHFHKHWSLYRIKRGSLIYPLFAAVTSHHYFSLAALSAFKWGFTKHCHMDSCEAVHRCGLIYSQRCVNNLKKSFERGTQLQSTPDVHQSISSVTGYLKTAPLFMYRIRHRFTIITSIIIGLAIIFNIVMTLIVL